MGNDQSTQRRSALSRRTTSRSPSGTSTPPFKIKSKSTSSSSSKRPTSKKPRRSTSVAPTIASDESSSIYEPQRVVIIGAGPVGALAALYFAKGGWQVTVYELRGDLRNPENRSLNFTKSINLAISERGVNGIRTVDPELTETILEAAIPMNGRMIHDITGKQSSQRYDVHGRFIRSIDRSYLNGALLDQLEQMSNVELKFNHNLKRLALEKSEATFEKRLGSGEVETVRVNADLFIGADGAHSQTRYHMMKYVRLNFSQEYIDSLWCEFHLPPHPTTGDFQLDPNHLHIWPRQTFMFIALPNMDKSFTCTLFMPEDMFKDIVGPEALLKFFLTEFPDVVPLIGEENLIGDYLKNQKLPLISVKCTPYHYRNKCVIIGDAAHAMVPFYGQGMNCGFEDVRVLWDHINSTDSLTEGLNSYTLERQKDLHVINDLAMNNYVEMRSSVTSRTYLMKKNFQEFLYSWFPWMGVRTLYSMVSFSNIRYSEVTKRVKRQEKVLGTVAQVVGISVLGALGWWVWEAGWWKEVLEEGLLVWKEWMEEAVRVLW
ncbi:kynurenine 3-monooxygenase, mitochondrial precursor [Orbilia oligospora]|uniref:Kynurenine 3-monooxygenase n=1 Tax=Orbilia oligospora TaxID=2813651 RepID=A0A7C8JBV3_ORBOL|nr:kynurenine 3-monooxygenase, mitochondrial precursor [Orbilia oligospora]KAF3082388.1 kynurenine 3-monooxygenase, mitochondrial precursor [Orbilia oligospora]KAF3089907.1 kynurenine 3-monooxygenase, mitochondrial precursor [Orbilia oligospora]KAF3125403.1 kynurenine 3-monooxygenase, mitochondrial precursor [Orbilia oligospora]KAF3138537.1 kynurenine 3-monooxygenase, mitochondrial precursor [Orbilia oligospora]